MAPLSFLYLSGYFLECAVSVISPQKNNLKLYKQYYCEHKNNLNNDNNVDEKDMLTGAFRDRKKREKGIQLNA